MKREYEKPAVRRAAELAKIAAADVCPSGYFYVGDLNGSGAQCVEDDPGPK